MKKKILTVSVAAYHVEKYLDQTLQSLCDERYLDRLEIFVVDDGGTDGSLKIAKEYESRYPDSIHAVHKDNAGYGSTINYSLEHASGKYFKPVDGDDWVNPDNLLKLLCELERCGEDIVISDYYIGASPEDLTQFKAGAGSDTVRSVKDYDAQVPHGIWAIYYRTDFLRSCGLKLPERTLYTDQIYNCEPFAYADKIHIFDIPVYCYRMGRTEQSVSRPSRVKHVDEMLAVCGRMYDFYEEHKSCSPYMLTRISKFYVIALKTLMLLPLNPENRARLMAYEKAAKKDHRELYDSAVTHGKTGQFIKLMRSTGYLAYWLIRFIPEHNLIN